MARSDNNLKAVLEDTANAIRSKTGGSSLIVPRDFADTIGTITKVEYTPQESSDLIKQLYSGTVVNAIVPDGVSSLHPFLFYQMTSLVSVDFNEVGTIPVDCCYWCTNLTTITFSLNTTRIEEGAFNNCTKLTDISIPHTITYVGNSAFYSVGSAYASGTHTFDFIDDVGVETYIENSAFAQSHLSHLKLTATSIGTNAFSSCMSLIEAEIVGDNCEIRSSAFYGCQNVLKFKISGVFTNLGDSAFSFLSQTAYTTPQIEPFDFSNSTFTSLGSNVWADCYFNGTIKFPATLSYITGNFMNYAQGNWTTYWLSVPSVLSASYLRDDVSGTFTIKYIFLYTLLATVHNATNWDAHTSQMLGFGTFQANDTLPTTQGTLTLTWYDSVDLTNQVSVASAYGDYYCTFA